MKLSKIIVDKLTYSREPVIKSNGSIHYPQEIVWDDAQPCFGVRIYPTGKKSFVIFYRINGQQKIKTIGRYGVFTLDEARAEARKRLMTVALGEDPMADHQKDRQTMKVLCDDYIERHAKPKKKSWRDDVKRVNNKILPAWAKRSVESISRADVAALHSRVGKTAPVEANATVRLLSKMFNLAAAWGYVPDNHANPAKGIEFYHEKKRDRWVTPVELPRLAEAIDTEHNPYIRAVMWLYLLTGARKSELLNAQWQHYDPEARELRLPDSKTKRIHYIPLNESAVAILEQLPRQEDNPHIFPGQIKGNPLVNISKPWNRIRKRAGVEDVRLHDLRRTVGSWLAQSGNSLHLIGHILGHSNQSTTAIYARFGQDHAREALEAHGKRIMGVAGKSDTAEVVPLSSKG